MKGFPKPLFLSLIFLSLLLIILDSRAVLLPVRSKVEKISVPLQGSFYEGSLKISSAFSFLTFWKEGQKKLEQLEQENQRLLGSVVQLESCRKENNDMRRLLAAPLPSNWRFLPAKVIGWDEGAFLLDKGLIDKVSNQMVAVYENVYLGRVVSLGENFSRLETVWRPSARLPVMIKNPADPLKVAYGLLSSSAEKIYLGRVLMEETISVGDLVLTSGETGTPVGLLIGKIVKVKREENNIFQEAEVELIFEPTKLETVFLIISK